MKTPKSSDSEEVTPSKKVLKQARLPFKTLSDVSPKALTPPSRKRKLSDAELAPLPKVGKIAKKNKHEEPIFIISDEDSNTATEVMKAPVHVNPIVKIVDKAREKKLQKSKGAKKRKGGAKKSKALTASNTPVVNNENYEGNEHDKVECMEMDVDEAHETNNDVTETQDKKKEAKEGGIESTENNIINLDDNSNSTDDMHNLIKNDETNPVIPIEKSNSTIVHKNDDKKSSKKQDTENEQEGVDLKEVENSNISRKSPKRSERIKSKIVEKNLDTSVVSSCDESLNSDPSTPRHSNRKVVLTNSPGPGDVSLNDSINTNLTPKQTQKKLELEKKKEEREKERLEREKKKQLEKEEKEKQKREKDEQKKREREEKEEVKRKEREEKEEQRKKEKEEKEKQRELEKKMREEKEEQKRKDKEEKEEQRKKEKEAREEEKRKRQEALEQEKQEQDQKKKKAAEAFVSFFVPKQKSEKDHSSVNCISRNNMLSSFTVKSDMRLAPAIRVSLDNDSRKTLDNLMLKQDVPVKSLYINSLKDGLKPLRCGKTWPLSDKDDDEVMIVEDELPPPVDAVSQIITCDSLPHEKLRPKLLAFHDNRRPPYWGTWRKKSSFIKPRQPFKTDEKHLDYEVDSDDEWEEEQDGESIDGSAAGSDDEPDADEYEVDNEVFVPHGYLSDEEATMDEDDVKSLSPETQKAKLKHLEDEFENEMKKPTEKLKPWFYGLSWETQDGGKPENCADAIWDYFGKFSMIMNDITPLLQPPNESVEPEKKKAKKKEQSPKAEKKKKTKLTEEKDRKKPKVDSKKSNQEMLKNQPGINTFLKKLKTA